MAQVIILDALYPEMEEATIGRWLTTEGERISEGQAIAELITDKVAYEFQSPVEGTVLAILPAEKSVIPVGTALAVAGDPGEAVDNLETLQAENRRLAAAREAALTALQEATATQAAPSAGEAGPARAVRATPAARRLARERGIDLATLHGSGPDGIITVEDIPAA